MTMKIHKQRDKMKIALGQALTIVNDTLRILERKTTSDNPDVDIITLKSVNFETDVRPVLMELRSVIKNWSFSDVFNEIPATDLIGGGND
tara:strand:- start:509 stop:778 length:270 start_codon:yes stop_codon:yes gene_type:complete